MNLHVQEGDDMDRGTESGREGDLESDAFQDFDGNSDKRGSIGPHDERKEKVTVP